MTCWACKCHTITSRKQEAKIIGLFLSCYCRQDTSTCKGEGDTKILEKLQKYILFMGMAIDTKIQTVFSWSWCTCHYTAPGIWSCNTNLLPVYYSLLWQKLTASFSQNRVNQMSNQNLVWERKKKGKKKICDSSYFLFFWY